jgi:HSP20 family molecular chaperone IbpA
MKRAPKLAAKVVVLENSDPIAAETEAIQGRIRQRAFELSQTRPPDAHALYDWVMAESEVISVPPAELTERDGKFELRLSAAGLNPDNLSVMISPNQILFKSEYSHQHDSGNGLVHFCDFKSATVFRSVDLPQAIDVNTVKVDSADGMILVTASKEGAAEVRPRRTAPGRKAPAKKRRAKTP